MFKKLCAIVLSFQLIFISAYVKAESSRLIYKDGGYCELFKDSNYDRLVVPNIPSYRYLEGKDESGIELSSDEKTIIGLEIKKDRNCINQAELIYLQTKTNDADKRARFQEQINSLSEQIKTADLSLKKLKEVQELNANLISNIEYELKGSDIIVIKQVVDEKTKILSDLQGLSDIIFEESKLTDSYFENDFKEAIDKFKDYDQSVYEEEKERIKNILAEKFVDILDSFHNRQESMQKEFKNALAAKLQSERFKYRNEVYQSSLSSEDAKTKYDAFLEVMDKKEELYFDYADSLFEVSQMQVTILKDHLEDFLGEYSYQSAFIDFSLFRNLIASNSSQILDIINNPGAIAATEIEAAQIKINLDASETMIKLLELMTSTDFRLLQVLKGVDAVEKAKDIVSAIENDDFETLKDIINDLPDSVIDDIHTQSDEIDKKNLEDTININNIINTLDEEDIPESIKIAIDDFNDTNILPEGISIDDMEELLESNFSNDINKLLIEVATAYQGYLSYLVFLVKKGNTPEKQLSIARVLHKKAIAVIGELENLFAADAFGKTNKLLRFQVLSNLNTFTKRIRESGKIKYVLSNLIKQRINLYSGEDRDLRDSISSMLAEMRTDDNLGDRKLLNEMHNFYGIALANNDSNYISEDSAVFRQVKQFFQRKRQGDPVVNPLSSDGTFSAMFQVSQDNASTYYHNPSQRYVIRKINNVIKQVVYYNSAEQAIVDVSEGIAVFYDYDSKGRLKSKTLALAKNTFDQTTEKFVLPEDFYAKNPQKTSQNIIIRKTEWLYVGDTDVIKQRKEYTPKSASSKITNYEYLSDSLAKIQTFDGNKKLFLERLEKIRANFSAYGIDSLLQTLVSRVEVKQANRIITRNDFYYNDLLVLEFIHEKKRKSERYVALSHINQEAVAARYEGIDFHAELDISSYEGVGSMFSQINPVFFMDSDGSILADLKELSFNKKYDEKILVAGVNIGDLGFNLNNQTNIGQGICGVNMSCEDDFKLNYFSNSYTPKKYEDQAMCVADIQSTENLHASATPKTDNKTPFDIDVDSLISIISDIADGATDFIKGATEELVLYGISAAVSGGFYAIVETMVKKVGLKTAVVRAGARCVPYLSAALLAADVYIVYTEYPDRIRQCLSLDMEECGRFSVDLGATVLGLSGTKLAKKIVPKFFTKKVDTHIFKGELYFDDTDGFVKSSGVHHMTAIETGSARIISDVSDSKLKKKWRDLGFKRYKVEVLGTSSSPELISKKGKWVEKEDYSTFFPDSWSREDVIAEINYAFKRKKTVGGKTTGVTSDGVPIKFIYDDSGNLLSAFPDI